MPRAKATETPTGQDLSRIDKILTGDTFLQIRKKHGKSILGKASDFGIMPVPRIPTGVFPVDLALSGGFPVGRVSLVYGPKASSKTTLVLKAIAQAQKMCANCFTLPETPDKPCGCGKFRETVAAYLDIEGTWNPDWAIRHGVNLDKLMLSIPEFAEQGIDIADALLRSGDCDVLALDSLAFLTPFKEIEESAAKDTMGVQARLVGRGIRKFITALNELGNTEGRRPTILLTNQIRMKLGVMFGNPETTPGGLAAGFATSTEVRVSAGKYTMDNEGAEAGFGKPLYADINFRVEKSKVGPARIEGEFRLNMVDTDVKKVGDVIDEPFMVAQAERVGLLKKEGGSWICMGESFDQKSQVEQRAMVDPLFKRVLREALMTVLLS